MRHTFHTPRLRALAAVILSLVLVASACGDDGDSAGGASFCELARQQQALADSFSFSASPDEIETYFRDLQSLTERGIAAAPNDAVKGALETMRNGTGEMISLLDAAEWDVFAVDSAQMEAIGDSPEFNAASETVEEYSETECGITDDDEEDAFDGEDVGLDPDLLDAALGSDAFREQMVATLTAGSDLTADQVGCLLDGLDSGLLASLAGGFDPSAAEAAGPFLEAMTSCGIDPTQFG